MIAEYYEETFDDLDDTKNHEVNDPRKVDVGK
jgi:hypothetical protein